MNRDVGDFHELLDTLNNMNKEQSTKLKMEVKKKNQKQKRQ